jgi:hypothetical protein
MLQGETIHSGAPDTCKHCKIKLELEILYSPAGWYIGTQCNCGPYSRESHYYRSRGAAETALKHDMINWRT